MKRIFAVLSIAVLASVMTIAAVAETPAGAQPEQLSKQQLTTLIATAKTAAEHQRIADYYEASAQEYRAQAQEHEAMVAAYRANTSLSNDKNRASTIGHCEYFVGSLKELAVKSDELAKLHKNMANEAGQK